MADTRYWNEKHLEQGFSYVLNEDLQEPLCLICDKKNANTFMRIGKMKGHFEAKHSDERFTLEDFQVNFNFLVMAFFSNEHAILGEALHASS